MPFNSLIQDRQTPRVKHIRLLEMVQNLPAGAAYVEENMLLFNASVEALIGYSSLEIQTLEEWFSTLYGENATVIRALYESHKRLGFPEPATVCVRHRDGTNRFVEFAAQSYESAEVWLLHDVTERVTDEAKFRVLFEYSSDAHLICNENGILDCNNAAIALLHCQDKTQLLSLHPAVLSPEYQPDGRRSLEKCVEMDAIACEQGYHRFEWMHRRLDGIDILVEVTLTPVKLNGRDALLTVWHDLTERKRLMKAEQKGRKLAEAQSHVLEMIAQGESLAQVLEAVVWLIEGQMPDAICSVLRLEGSALRHGAAPSLPEAYTKAIDGVAIGPMVGSCGTAAYRKEAVIVTDIASDPLWSAFAELALSFDLRACWSWPIVARDGAVLGTFAVYYRTPQHPSEEELNCGRQATHLAGVALQRDRREEALRKSNEQLQRQQAELRTANEQLERQKTEMKRANTHLKALATTDGLTGLKNHGRSRTGSRKSSTVPSATIFRSLSCCWMWTGSSVTTMLTVILPGT